MTHLEFNNSFIFFTLTISIFFSHPKELEYSKETDWENNFILKTKVKTWFKRIKLYLLYI